MKEKIIIYLCGFIAAILLIAVLWSFTGFEEFVVGNGWGEMYLWCQPCQKELGGTYFIAEGYWFQCSTCGTIYANAQWAKVGNKKYKNMFGIDLIGGETDLPDSNEWSIRLEDNLNYLEIIDSNFVTVPNKASYKGWFGWE